MRKIARPPHANGVEPASAPVPAPGPGAASGAPEEDHGSIAADIRAVVENAVSAVGRTGYTSVSGVADAVEGAGRALARRVVEKAVADPRHVPDHSRLAEALAEKPGTTLLAGGTAAAASARLLRRFGPLKFLGKRTPAFLLATAVPALVASVSRGADELGLVSAHLVLRAREAHVEPDPEVLRRVAVQVVTGAPIDPTDEPRHGPLALAWLRRAARASLPFTAGVATRDPEGIAARTAAVDPAILRGPVTPAA
jgi:hypothetical protein